MQLGDLFDDLTLDVATSSVEITRVDIDSRECQPGSLFFALAGSTNDGAAFVNDAVDRGAVVIVADRALNVRAPLVIVPTSQLRALLAHASATIEDHPEAKAKLVGVTGTNGKTSVTTILAALGRALEWNAASIGTLTQQRTTPAAPDLYRSLARAVETFDATLANALIAMEVSSHALDQRRVEGLRYCVVAFYQSRPRSPRLPRNSRTVLFGQGVALYE